MKILICDDCKNIVEELNTMLLDFSTFRKNIFEIEKHYNGKALMNSANFYDIAFIDIEMPDVNGLTLTRHLKSINPDIIVFIVTSFNGYLDDAMDLNVFRYLSKPIDKSRLFKGLETALLLYNRNNENIVIEDNIGCHTVNMREILYFTIYKRKTKIVTEKESYISNQSLEYWKKATNDYICFTQPHYSYIVNMQNITLFNRFEITVSRGDKTEIVPISRGHYNDFKDSFFKFMGVTI